MENRIIELAINGHILSKDVKENNIPTIYLSRLEKKGKIKKVSRGIYVLNDYIEDYFYIYASQYSKLVYTNLTALYLNNLTNRQFTGYEAIFPYGTNTKDIPIKGYVTRNKDMYELGIDYILTPYGNKVKCHDRERCICNVFLFNLVDEEEKAYIIKEYIQNYLNIEKLYSYAKKLGCYERIKDIFEIVLWD